MEQTASPGAISSPQTGHFTIFGALASERLSCGFTVLGGGGGELSGSPQKGHIERSSAKSSAQTGHLFIGKKDY
jgi:hypothetical protein